MQRPISPEPQPSSNSLIGNKPPGFPSVIRPHRGSHKNNLLSVPKTNQHGDANPQLSPALPSFDTSFVDLPNVTVDSSTDVTLSVSAPRNQTAQRYPSQNSVVFLTPIPQGATSHAGSHQLQESRMFESQSLSRFSRNLEEFNNGSSLCSIGFPDEVVMTSRDTSLITSRQESREIAGVSGGGTVTIMPRSPSTSDQHQPATILLSSGGHKTEPGSVVTILPSVDGGQTGAKLVPGSSTLFKNAYLTTENGQQVITVNEQGGQPSYVSLTPVNPMVSDGNGAGLEGPNGGAEAAPAGVTMAHQPGTIIGMSAGHNFEDQQESYPIFSGDSTMFSTATMYTSTTQPQYSQELSAQAYTLVNGNSQAIVVSDQEHQTPTSTRANPHSNEDQIVLVTDNDPLSVAKVSPLSVQWLKENYETAEGVSLPRSTLYTFYLRHSAEIKIDPVNAASFGKLIRSVFPNLRTRRLGTRGNSKYHYYGIRVNRNSPLYALSEEECNAGGSPTSSASPSPSAKRSGGSGSSHFDDPDCSTSGVGGQQGKMSSYDGGQSGGEASPQTLSNQKFLGPVEIVRIPELSLQDVNIPPGVTLDQVKTFSELYKDHCRNLFEAVYNLKFQSVELLWRKFWWMEGSVNDSPINGEGGSKPSPKLELEDGELTNHIPGPALQVLLSCPFIVSYIEEADYQFYQSLVDVLIPDVLKSIPSPLTQSIRNFAKSLECSLAQALTGVPPQINKVKMTAVSSFGQMLKRYTSLNHLAQAARAVLHNTDQIKQMLQDLNRVDFHNVHEQASWVCGCDEELVLSLEEDFKQTLEKPSSLEEWAKWLAELVDKILEPHVTKTNFAMHARQFLLKWSFYSSMVIRDLTLRSAASFGSFHLIRLLYDEYMFYVVEDKVASVLKKTPIAVMAQFQPSPQKDFSHSNGIDSSHSPMLERSLQPPLKKIKFESSTA